MEKKELPNKIWLDTKSVYFGKPTDKRVTEYTSTDVFMKKAKEAFCKAMCNGCPPRSTCTSLGTCREYDNFVKILEGE